MAHASSSHFSPLVLCSKKLYSSRLSRPLPSKSITSKMSDNTALWNKTVQHLCTYNIKQSDFYWAPDLNLTINMSGFEIRID